MVTVKHYCIYFYVSNALTHSVYEIANGVFICVNNIHNPFVNPNLINITYPDKWERCMQYFAKNN